MIQVLSTERSKKIGHYLNAALTQPVVVTRNGRDSVVMILADEYRRLKRRDRQVIATADAPEGLIKAVWNAEMDSRHDHLDRLLRDWTPRRGRRRSTYNRMGSIGYFPLNGPRPRGGRLGRDRISRILSGGLAVLSSFADVGLHARRPDAD